jgi:2-(1,2-epoxy-1,2-dihydrophenyl)acetyl-CoA isomerase
VLVEVSGGVATITLNRPDAYNSLDLATKEALRDAILDAGSDMSIRALVLTGRGKAFCTGQDLEEHARLLGNRDGSPFTTVREHFNPMITALATMPKPVVAAVNGVAAGAGVGLALAADLRIVSDGARFVLAFAGVGLTADSGLSWMLPRLVGWAKATELLMLPAGLDAEGIIGSGLAIRAVPSDEIGDAAAELATQLANGPTAAFAAIKESLAYGMTHSLADTLEHEAVLQNATGLTADHAEAVTAFNAKRPAVFAGR